MYFFLIADKLLAIVFRMLVSNYIFVHLECDIKCFTVWKKLLDMPVPILHPPPNQHTNS